MTLSELEPRWVHPQVLVFQCPHCRSVLLSCKSIVMSMAEQVLIFYAEFGDHWNTLIVPCRPETAWNITGVIPNLTVTPSIDASASGHWHGHITAGVIQ